MKNRNIWLPAGGLVGVLAILGLIIAGLLFWLLPPDPAEPATGGEPATTTPPPGEQQVIRTERPHDHTPGKAPLSVPAGQTQAPGPPPRPLLDGLNDPTQTIQDDLDRVQSVFDTYESIFQQHPIGEHTEVIRAFMGDNPRGLSLIPEDSPHIDETGHLRDRWGTPFFFHAIAHNRVEILSAGPDQSLWTEDDVKSRDYPVHPPTESGEAP